MRTHDNLIEGGFHPGPLVRVSGGDTTAAHVRLIPPSLPVRASCAPRFQVHHNNYIYILLFSPQTNIWDASTFVCGKVSNNHEKQEQEQEEW